MSESPKTRKPRRPKEDLTGMRFGKLVVVGLTGKKKSMAWEWLCKCDCGGTAITRCTSLTTGITRSCGCLRKETNGARLTTHGRHNTKPYLAWHNMVQRCKHPKNPGWKNYGGRGITVCDRWVCSFENFLADMGEPPENATLDRIDNDKGYSPDNCRWVDWKTNMNNRRCNVYIEWNGEKLTPPQWSERTGLKAGLISRRFKEGWDIELALTAPPKSVRRRK